VLKRALVSLYPRAWRARYGTELEELIRYQRLTPRIVLDLVAGAIDAHLHAGSAPGVSEPVGGAMLRVGNICGPSLITPEQQRNSAIWMLAGTAVLAVVYLGLKRLCGDGVLIEAFGYAAFPIAVTLSARTSYLRSYSAPASIVILGTTVAAVYGILLAATIISRAL